MKDPHMEEKKNCLNRYRRLCQIEERLQNKLNTMEQHIQSIRSPRIDGMPRGGTPIDLADLLSDKQELEDRIRVAHSRKIQCKSDILKAIDLLENPLQADILESYFIKGKSMEEISEELGYNSKYLYRIYSKAIECISL